MNKKIILTLMILCVSIALSACQVIQAVVKPVKDAAPGTLLFSDDFSSTGKGWGTMGRQGGEVGIDFQGLIIKVNIPQFMFWSVNGENFRNTKIDVDAVLLNGPTDDNFGVICRFRDNNNFYGFLISHDGYYGIFKMLEGKMILASQAGNLEYSDSIRQGGIVNHIEATCNEKILSLTVNDQLLAEIQDDSFSSGQVGLIAGAYGTPGVQVLFDNLKVYQP